MTSDAIACDDGHVLYQTVPKCIDKVNKKKKKQTNNHGEP